MMLTALAWLLALSSWPLSTGYAVRSVLVGDSPAIMLFTCIDGQWLGEPPSTLIKNPTLYLIQSYSVLRTYRL
jgi:hypothetical protein